MEKVIQAALILFIFTLLSCQHVSEGTKDGGNETGDLAHLGAWELIYFQSINGNDTTERTRANEAMAITLFTPSYFSFHWRGTSFGGAGIYSYDGKIIHQKFEYVKDAKFQGAVLSFNMEVRNDSIIFSGPLTAVSASGEDMMGKIPQMLEIRRRVK